MASTPAAWPSSSGRSRRRAQRRLPSMMIATWRGSSSGGQAAGSRRRGTVGVGPAPRVRRRVVRRGRRVGRAGEVARATRPRGPPLPSPPPRRSTSAMWRSVVFWSVSSWRCASSVPTSPSRSSFLSSSAASRRRLRISTRASSIRLWTTRTRSLRRSSVSGGMFEPDDRAVDVRHQPDVALGDRLLDGAQDAAVPRLDDDLVRLGDADPGQLVERRRRCRSSRHGCARRAPSRRGRSGCPGSRAPWPRPRDPSCGRRRR